MLSVPRSTWAVVGVAGGPPQTLCPPSYVLCDKSALAQESLTFGCRLAIFREKRTKDTKLCTISSKVLDWLSVLKLMGMSVPLSLLGFRGGPSWESPVSGEVSC